MHMIFFFRHGLHGLHGRRIKKIRVFRVICISVPEKNQVHFARPLIMLKRESNAGLGFA